MILRPGSAIILLLLLCLVTPMPAAAQAGQSPFGDGRIVPLQPVRQDKLATARKLIVAQRFQEAADLLEPVYDTDQNNDLVISLLRTCYDQLQSFDKAERLVRRLIEKDPQALGHRLYLAELLVRLNRESEALGVYGQIETMIENSDPSRFKLLIGSLVAAGLDRPALDAIDRARARFRNPMFFALERGNVLERQQDYRGAVGEYLPPLLQDTTDDANRAEVRLLALLQFESSSNEVEQLLKAVADSASGYRAMRLLTEHYIRADRFDDAFAYARKQDSIEGGEGLSLVTLARRCGERRLWPQVVGMTDFILQKYPGGRFQIEVMFNRAQALAELSRVDEAVQVYRRMAELTDDPQVRADACYGIGVLHSEYRGDCRQAMIFYDSVLSSYPRGRGYLMARKAKAVCHLRLGQLDQARSLLGLLLASRLPDDFREEAAYYQGLVEFFDRKYDTAQLLFRKLTVDFPKGFYVNDAQRLILAYDDAKTLSAILDSYSAARYARFRKDDDSALVCLKAIVESRPLSLGDLALFEVVEIELERADTLAALDAAERLAQDYPDSYYRPLGIKIKADLLAGSAGDIKQAAELYRYLLENCSEYPFTREIREKLRALDARLPVG